jgi:hypothetical protein
MSETVDDHIVITNGRYCGKVWVQSTILPMISDAIRVLCPGCGKVVQVSHMELSAAVGNSVEGPIDLAVKRHRRGRRLTLPY